MKSSRNIGRSNKNTGTTTVKQKRRPNLNPSRKQLEQRAKFATAIRFTRTLANLLTETFADDTNDKLGVNKAISQVFKGAIYGTYPDYVVDYSAVFVSRGLLPNAVEVTISSDSPGAIRFVWTDRPALTGFARPTDRAVLVAHCPECERSTYRKSASRMDMADTLMVNGFKNKVVYTWLLFVSEDGLEVSDSLYTGPITVQG